MTYIIKDVKKYLDHFQICFWDFDGVIKDSVDVKTYGYIKLFAHCNKSIVDQIEQHHLKNGGISRFEKIPFYFKKFLNKELNATEIQQYSDQYSDYVKNEVLNSDWVPGVRTYLKSNQPIQKHYIVTGTPQDEIVWIASHLGITNCFQGICGSPDSKKNILNRIMSDNNYKKEQCVMIGDSLTDYDAAKSVNISFLLRNTSQNKYHFVDLNCGSVNDFR